jgi:hypothetical protein
MGQIVAAMATVHAPQLFTRPPEEDAAQLDASIAAMRELGERLEDAKPDAVILFGSDHMETFFLQSGPPFPLFRVNMRRRSSLAGPGDRPFTRNSPKPYSKDLSIATST